MVHWHLQRCQTGGWNTGATRALQQEAETVHDPVDLAAARELSATAAKASEQWLSSQMACSSSGIESDITGSYDIPEVAGSNFVAPARPEDDLMQAMQAEVCSDLHRQSKIKEQEDKDEYEALEAQRLRAVAAEADPLAVKGAGRPRKSPTEILAEVSKLLRDRVRFFEDTATKMQRTMMEALNEASSRFPALPPDVIQVKTSMEKDVKQQIDKIFEGIKSLQETNVQKLVDSVPGDCTAEAVRNKVMEEGKMGMQAAVSTGNRAISAFRLAVKNAGKSPKKKTKIEVLGDRAEKPRLTIELEKLLADSLSTDGRLHVEVAASWGQASKTVPCYVTCNAQLTVDLKGVSGVAAHAKWIRQELAKSENQALGGALSVYRPTVFKAATKVLQKGCKGSFVSDMPFGPSHTALKDDLFGVQHWLMDNTHTNVGATAFGIGEVRYLINGSYMLAGVLLSELPGNSLQEKIERTLSAEGLTEFMAACKNVESGFFMVHDAANTCVRIPPGYLVTTSSMHAAFGSDTSGANGIRWGWIDYTDLMGAEQKVETFKFCKKQVEDMIQTYPELAHGHYARWVEFLDRQLGIPKF